MTTKSIAAGADTPAAAEPGNRAAGAASISVLSISPSSPSVNRKAAARELLTTLWTGGGWAYWWQPNGPSYIERATGKLKQAGVSLWFPTGRPAPIPAAWRDTNIYFGVHPCSEKWQPWQRSTKKSISAVNCVFAEFDAKHFAGGKDAIMAHLDSLYAYPTAIVDSGGGFHCYWLLGQSIAVNERNRLDLEMVQESWVALVGGDTGAQDLARILRVPGTLNFKYSPARPVTLIEYASNRRFDFDHVRLLVGDRLEQLKSKTERRIEDDARRTADVAPGAAHQLLQWAVANVRPGARHNMALWLCGRLKDENIEPWVADAVVRDFLRRVGDNPERDEKQAAGIVKHIYGGV